ncbi:hypothetical protein CCOS865_02276 [Pseudomonas reidholzensis]|uniref:Uncharacterized protein n=1 Tax=Pseudomonas reidholzensis TaxID=1785162 RepID=A0A383RSF8_9PSED|nr:hypothetical protein [Pseudomonas reidholzensis]SYX90010.1 hypothetical protein CCOS865_02276 [Pseudomonas reidholzensis]
MSWEKVGKSLVGLLVVGACAAGLYTAFKEDPALEARLTYAYLTYPSQFSERISKANDLLRYERLHDRMSDISDGLLSHQQVDKLIDLAQEPYAQLFAKPFEAGLVDHRTGLLIELENTRDTPLKDVQIRLPAKGLVQIRDDAGNDIIPQTATSVVDIATLGAGEDCKVWVYFDSDYSQVRQGALSIRHADGVAQVRAYREFIGFPATVAKYSQVLVAALAALVLAVLGLGYSSLRRRST